MNTEDNFIKQTFVISFLAASIGWICVVAPNFIISVLDETNLKSISSLLTNNEYNILFSPILLIVSGIVLGIIKPQACVLFGVSTPLLGFFEIFIQSILNTRSHNLWPIEMVSLFVLVSGPATLGTLIGTFINRTYKHQHNKPAAPDAHTAAARDQQR